MDSEAEWAQLAEAAVTAGDPAAVRRASEWLRHHHAALTPAGPDASRPFFALFMAAQNGAGCTGNSRAYAAAIRVLADLTLALHRDGNPAAPAALVVPHLAPLVTALSLSPDLAARAEAHAVLAHAQSLSQGATALGPAPTFPADTFAQWMQSLGPVAPPAVAPPPPPEAPLASAELYNALAALLSAQAQPVPGLAPAAVDPRLPLPTIPHPLPAHPLPAHPLPAHPHDWSRSGSHPALPSQQSPSFRQSQSQSEQDPHSLRRPRSESESESQSQSQPQPES
ncbi:hypothetical protein H9P43_003767 [Blastocladiella emersonii ATCC 22665]|nr:hypothetical protein H9P43_003753 [Blastocladiella emersonii ATCC 22665]KAI9182857.1 hypothetical protein H9P43_003767 [Blastocladiella emersonii ATCC 22665]